jgi:pimeloyl-ACP methyl ester carboxylesterase
MAAHAVDLVAATEHLGPPLVLTGQSMGGYAALRAAAARPELFTRLVLVDGGLPPPVPDGVDPDQLLELTVGPAVVRLRQTSPTSTRTWTSSGPKTFARPEVHADRYAPGLLRPDAVPASGGRLKPDASGGISGSGKGYALPAATDPGQAEQTVTGAPCRHPYQAVRSAQRGGPAAGPLPPRVGRRATGGQQARCAATAVVDGRLTSGQKAARTTPNSPAELGMGKRVGQGVHGAGLRPGE